MALDVLQNYAEATVTTSLNGTDAAGTAETVTVSGVSGSWVGLAAGQQMRVVDKADLNAGVGYEIMILTADASGVAGSWTLTRGAEGSTVKAHTANWTLVPSGTAGGLASFTSGSLIALTTHAPNPSIGYGTASTTLVAIDSTNLSVSFEAPESGEILVSLTGMLQAPNHSLWGLLTHGTTTVVDSWAFYNLNEVYRTAVRRIAVTPGTVYSWDWAFAGVGTDPVPQLLCGSVPGGDWTSTDTAVMEIRRGM